MDKTPDKDIVATDTPDRPENGHGAVLAVFDCDKTDETIIVERPKIECVTNVIVSAPLRR